MRRSPPQISKGSNRNTANEKQSFLYYRSSTLVDQYRPRLGEIIMRRPLHFNALAARLLPHLYSLDLRMIFRSCRTSAARQAEESRSSNATAIEVLVLVHIRSLFVAELASSSCPAQKSLTPNYIELSSAGIFRPNNYRISQSL